MNTDPEMRGTGGGSTGSAGPPQSGSANKDLQKVLERVVVTTCFKGTLAGADGNTLADASQVGPQAPPALAPPAATRKGTPRREGARTDAMRQAEARDRTRARNHNKSPDSAAKPGEVALAGLQRFLAVLDKVYAKVLTDGDFDFVGFMRARSLGPSEMLDLLEACAVRLGEEWRCDSLGFVRVVVATSRLQRILTTLSQENRCFEPFVCDRSMLLIIPRGETHLFAVSLIEERFRLKGWETRFVFADRFLDLPHLLETSDFQLICLAWLDSALKNQVETVLHAISTSVNRERTCVIAGGPAAEDHSQWLEERGVEKVCSNADIAINTAERLGATRISAHSAAGINGSLLEPSQSA
ncbi:hypothetical protein [Hoeflea sp.]|uniref:hypothetical protein n=1 Tax=Hoeflea sp. TaxID=1940281 RepID=UPI00198E9AAF|nr:hypothetical protein [Hoeflea sp.]MBC7283519.1 hypothetical protein [Hoeflea sp.]